MAAVTSCPDGQVLKRFSMSQLSDWEAEVLEAHLLRCDRCAGAVNALVGQDALMQAMRGSASVLRQPRDSAIESLIAKLSGQQPPPAPNDGGNSPAFPNLQGESGEVSAGDSDGSASMEATAGGHDAGTDTGPDTLAFLAPAEEGDEIGRLGGYRVLRLLGKGGMGLVFLAEDPRLRRKVALKVMRPALASDPDQRQRFIREAQAAAAIEHDHIVTIFQVGEDRGVPFLAMQLLKGQSLEEWLKQGRQLSPAQVLRIGREIAKGLAAAHERGLLHRDIKPANIWIEHPTGRVKIVDFGLARGAEDPQHLTRSGYVVGTPAYMAPENYRGELPDQRSDLFSLGCVLYRLCTGRLPFQGKDIMQTLMVLATADPPPIQALNPKIPAALAELVTQLLAKDRSQRPDSARSVAEALQRIEKELAGATPAQGVLLPGTTPAPHSSSKATPAVTPRPPPPAAAAEPEPTESVRAEPTVENKLNAGKPTPSRARLWLATGAVVAAAAIAAVAFSLSGDPAEPAPPRRPGVGDPPPVVTAAPALAPFDAKQARAHQEAWAAHLRVPVEITNSLGMRLRLIPPGEFQMAKDYRVCVTRPFRLGVHEVTVGQFRAFVKETGYKTFAETSGGGYTEYEKKRRKGPNHVWSFSPFAPSESHPVTMLSWEDAVRFCEWLSAKDKRTYRLPTEAEWEWACRAGTVGPYYFGDERLLDEHAWHEGNAALKTHPVGLKKANPWGLTDLYGNVCEFCQDWHNPFPTGVALDPRGPASGDMRVVRGLGFPDGVDSQRRGMAGVEPYYHFGFRVVLEEPVPASPGPPLAVAPFDTAQARAHQEAWARHLLVPVELSNSVGMRLRLIPPGEFLMGSPDALADALPNEKPQHVVRLTQPFFAGVHEVTVAQFRAFAQARNYKTEAESKGAEYWDGAQRRVLTRSDLHWLNPPFAQQDDHPATCLTWNDGQRFCEWLSEKEGVQYRLPTEAEWEYCCRAGTVTATNAGPTMDRKHANLTGAGTRATGSAPANPFGLHDLVGNVYEWCADGQRPYTNSAVADPSGPVGPTDLRVKRGGAYSSGPLGALSARRDRDPPSRAYLSTGIRVVLQLPTAGSPSNPARLQP